MTEISVVIPVYNAEKTLAATLDSLMKQSLDRNDYEILVIDNGSTDSSAEIIKSYPVTYQAEPKRGAAAARNKGIRNSKSPWIAFTDSDCIAYPDWLTRLIKAADSSSADVIGGRIAPYRNSTMVEKYLAARQNKILFPQEQAINGEQFPFRYVITANAMVRKSALEEVGMFDERFEYAVGEDVELGERLERAGCTFHYEESAVVLHWNVDSLGGLYHHFYMRGYYGLRYPAADSSTSGWFQRRLNDLCVLTRLMFRAARAMAMFIFEKPMGTSFFDLVVDFAHGMGLRTAQRNRWTS
jgi:glycosyltransferase involved in cell wall biosynthesis